MSNVVKKEPMIMTKKKTEGDHGPEGDGDETDEIMEEMRADGVKVDEEGEDDDEAAAGTTEDELDEAEDEGKKNKGKKKDKKKEDDDSEESDDEESDDDDSKDDEEIDEDAEGEEDDDDADDDEDDDDADEGNRKRPIKTIPAWQHKKEMRQQEKRLKRELSGAATTASESGEDVDEDSDEVLEIVKNFGLDEEQGPKFVKAIINAAAKRGDNVSSEDMKKMKETLADQEEERLFGRELKKVTPFIREKMPDVSAADVDKIKDKVRDLAYTAKYQKYSLEDIVTLNVEALTPKKKKKSGEKGRSTGATRSVESYDLDNPDSIPWAELSDEEFDKVSEALEKRSSKNKILRKGQRIN